MEKRREKDCVNNQRLSPLRMRISIKWSLFLYLHIKKTIKPINQIYFLLQIIALFCLSGAAYALHVPEVVISKENGTLNVIEVDLTLKNMGPDIELFRNYTPDSGMGMFGKDWTSSIEAKLFIKADKILIVGTSYDGILNIDEQGVFRQESGNYPLIRKEKNHYILESSNREKFIFNSFGFLTRKIHPNGKFLLFEYTKSGDNFLLNRITDGNRDILTFHYKGLLCSKVEAPEGRIFQYEYNGDLLSRVFYPDGTQSKYNYKEGYLHEIETPSSLNASFELGENHRVDSHKDLLSIQWNYRYHKEGNWNLMTKTSDDGIKWSYRIKNNDTGRVVRISDSSGNFSEGKFHKQGYLLESTDRAGATTKYKYDGRGNISQKVDPIGLITHFETDPESEQIVAVTTPSGNTYNYKYDDAGNIAKITKPDDSTVSYTYNKTYDIITKKDEAGAITKYKRDHWGNVVEITYPNGSSVKRKFDSYGNLLEEIDIRGLKRKFGYDRENRLIWIEGISGRTEMIYDARGYLVSQESPSGKMIRYKRDKFGRITTVTSSGYELQYTYDRYGRLVLTQRPDGAVIKNRYDKLSRLVEQDHFRKGQRRFLYDTVDRLTTVLFKDGTKEKRRYDLLGRIISFTDRKNSKTQYVYGNDGKVSRISNPKEDTLRYEYNSRGLLSAIYYPDGAVVTREYGPRGELLKWTDGEGKTKRYEYNNAGQLVQAIDRNGEVTVMKYDNIGRLVQKEYPGKIIEEWIYDRAGRVSSREITDAGKTSYSYDFEGRLVESMGVPLKSFTREYGPEGRVSGIIVPDGTSVQFKFDEMGNIAAIRDQNGIEEKFSNDVKTHTMTYLDAHMKKRSFIYSEGKVVGINKPDGAVLEYVRDSLGNIIEERALGKLLSKRSYDKMGNLIRAENEEGTFLYEYDSMGRLKRLFSSVLSMELNYKYDHAGRLSRVLEKDSTGKSRMIHHSYDGEGRRIETTDWDGRKYHMVYDKAGRLASVVYPGGTAIEFLYGDGLRPIGERLVIAGGKGSTEKEYQRDEWGRIKSVKNADSSNSFYYDEAGRLIEVKDAQGSALFSYKYDKKGNRLKGLDGKTYEYDKADQLVSLNHKEVLYQYDVNGNLVSVTKRGDKTLYRYDVKDRLIEVKLATGDLIRFGYDPFGNLFRYEKNGKSFFFFNDGLNIYAVLDSENKVLRRYLHGQGIDRPLARRGQEGIDFLIVNATGDVGATISETEKKTVIFRYLPFGNLADNNTLDDNILPPFLYKGRPYFAELGMYNMRARWYLPSLGRFLIRDKLSFRLLSPHNLHAYLYSANDPINYYDTMGTQPADLDSDFATPSPYPESEETPEGGRFGIEADLRVDFVIGEIGVNPVTGNIELTGKLPLHLVFPGLNLEVSGNVDIGSTGNTVLTRPEDIVTPFPMNPVTGETYLPPIPKPGTQPRYVNKTEGGSKLILEDYGAEIGFSYEYGIGEIKVGVGGSANKGMGVYAGGAGAFWPFKGGSNLGPEGALWYYFPGPNGYDFQPFGQGFNQELPKIIKDLRMREEKEAFLKLMDDGKSTKVFIESLIDKGFTQEANDLLAKMGDEGDKVFENLPTGFQDKLLEEPEITEQDIKKLEEANKLVEDGNVIVKLMEEGKTDKASEQLEEMGDKGDKIFDMLPQKMQEDILTHLAIAQWEKVSGTMKYTPEIHPKGSWSPEGEPISLRRVGEVEAPQPGNMVCIGPAPEGATDNDFKIDFKDTANDGYGVPDFQFYPAMYVLVEDEEVCVVGYHGYWGGGGRRGYYQVNFEWEVTYAPQIPRIPR